jgi:hypothetical protein
MPRQVVSKKDIAAAAAASTDDVSNYGAVTPRSVQVQKPDGYFDRFLKYIPTEIVVVYVTIINGMDDGANAIALWVVYGLCQIAVPIFLWAIGVRKKKQLFISFLSFFFWAASYGGPFHTIGRSKHLNVCPML